MQQRRIDVDEIRLVLENERRRLNQIIKDQQKRYKPINEEIGRRSIAWKYEQRKRRRKQQMRERTEKKLNLVESALERIHKNTYGKCSSCGKPIPVIRLNTIPYADLCIDCQIEKEKQN